MARTKADEHPDFKAGTHEVLVSYRIPKKKAKYQRFLEDEE